MADLLGLRRGRAAQTRQKGAFRAPPPLDMPGHTAWGAHTVSQRGRRDTERGQRDTPGRAMGGMRAAKSLVWSLRIVRQNDLPRGAHQDAPRDSRKAPYSAITSPDGPLQGLGSRVAVRGLF